MRIFGYDPAVILYALNALVGLVVAFGVDLTTGQVDAITTIATGILTMTTAALTRPVVVSALTGALATVLNAVAAFGLDLTADQVSAVTIALSVTLMLLLRQHVSPVPALRRGGV